jgi:transketolase
MQLKHEPLALILSRQALPTLDRTRYAPASGVAKGAYVLADAKDGKPELILMATGSEVSLCVSVYEQLTAEGRRVRVVSMPSWEIFEQQTPEYRESVIPRDVKARISVEQASTLGWSQYVGSDGITIGMKTFGASAPLKELLKKFGFTPEAVIAAARKLLGDKK